MRRFAVPCCAFLFALLTLGVGATRAAAGGEAALRIGMVRTLFPDMNDGLIKFVINPFVGVMRDTSGVDGKLVVGSDALSVAGQISKGELDLGVFHGFEFAWVQQKYPDLRPLMLAVDARSEPRAYVLVPKDGGATTFADLKGKAIAVPMRTKESARLFVERLSQKQGGGSARDFFGAVVRPANVEAALDELRDGKKVQAAVVNGHGLAFYKDLKPGAFARLRVLEQSEPVPPVVLAYCTGRLDEPTLGKLREGLRKAHATERGAALLKTWQLTGFEEVPANFGPRLAACRKLFPMTLEE